MTNGLERETEVVSLVGWNRTLSLVVFEATGKIIF